MIVVTEYLLLDKIHISLSTILMPKQCKYCVKKDNDCKFVIHKNTLSNSVYLSTAACI